MAYNSLIDRTGVASLIPIEYSKELLNMVTTEGSVVMRLARRLRNMARYQETLPVISALPTAYFVNGETGLKQTTEVSWEDKSIYAAEVAAIIPIPESVLDDADLDIWAEVRPLIGEALGLVIDNAVLYGTNAPSTWPTAIVTAAASASNTVALGTGADLYEDTLGEDGTIALLEADGYMATGHVAHLTMRGKLRGLRDADGGLLFTASPQAANSYMLDGVGIEFPLNGAASSSYPLISGQWNQLVYAMRQDITWKILTEAVIQDGSGNIVYNLAQQDMIALRVVMRLGFQLPNPINRINTSSTTRYPFVVLTG